MNYPKFGFEISPTPPDHPPPSRSVVPPSTNTSIPPTESTSTTNPTSSPKRNNTITEYQFDVEYDHAKHILDVRQIITFTNPLKKRMSSIIGQIESNRDPGYFTLASLAINGNEITDYQLTTGKIFINLNPALEPGEEVTITVQYTERIPSRQGCSGWVDRQVNLCDWYIQIPPFQSDGTWIIHPPALVGENLVYDKANFAGTFRIINAPPGIQIAAAGEWQEKQNVFTFHHRNARNITLSISNQFIQMDKAVNEITVKYFAFEEDKEAAKASMEIIGKALSTFSSLWLPYPHPSLTIVESVFADGLESDGMFFVGQEYFKEYDGTFKNWLSIITIHETAHMWWFGMVGNDQAIEPWLDEAFCTYAEYQFLEKEYAISQPELLEWWWNFRINNYSPEGYVNQTIYDFTSYRGYINAVYLRGALFLDTLRRKIGADQFLLFQNELLIEHQNQRINSHLLFEKQKSFAGYDDMIIKTYFLP